MSTLAEIAKFFAAFTTNDVMIGVAATAAVLVLIADWRISLTAFALQYLLITVLLTSEVQLEVALVRLISGGLVSFMLYITVVNVRARWMRRARAAGWQNAGEIASLFEREPFVIGLPFRLIALALVGISVVSFTSQYTFPNVPPAFWLVSLWLCSAGLLLVAFSRDALKVGMGILTFSSGFGALYLALEPSLLFYGLLLITDLVVALGVAHLASAPVQPATGARRRGES